MENKCSCFTCRHKGEPRLLKAYCVGWAKASEWFLNWAQRHNLTKGNVAGDSLEDLYAQIDWNYMENGAYMECLPDIEDGRNVEMELKEAQSKILGLESELNETLEVLYKAAPEKREWIKLNFPKFKNK